MTNVYIYSMCVLFQFVVVVVVVAVFFAVILDFNVG